MKTAFALVGGLIGALLSFRWLRSVLAAPGAGSSSSVSSVQLPPIKFTPAKYFRPGPPGGRKIRWIVIHTAECAETPGAAEGGAAFFANPPNVASAHYWVDNDSITQSVKDSDVAHAAPPLNDEGLHIELSGFARQTPEEWADAYSKGELELAARLVAAKALEHHVPLDGFLTSEQLNPGDKLSAPDASTPSGITAHMFISRAFHKSDHQDPGKGFPFEAFMARVRELAA